MTKTLRAWAAAAGAGSLTPSERQDLQSDSRPGAQQIWRRLCRQEAMAAAEAARLHGLQQYERALWSRSVTLIAGVDEAGAGPLAGPVVAAAVILPRHCTIAGIDDSKKLSAKARARIFERIKEVCVACSVGQCSMAEIDRLNIYQASLLSMARAVQGLAVTPEHLLVDARRIPKVAIEQTSLVRGDSLSQSIAAASIVAKVTRDALMRQYDSEFPEYGFAQHLGYGTAQHLQQLQRLGPCPIHRRTFAPVMRVLESSRLPVSGPGEFYTPT